MAVLLGIFVLVTHIVFYFTNLYITIKWLLHLIAYGYKTFLNTSCENYKYGQYNELEEAKQACKEDKNCTAVYDVECGDGGLFHLCPDMEDVLSSTAVSSVSCIHEKVIVGKWF